MCLNEHTNLNNMSHKTQMILMNLYYTFVLFRYIYCNIILGGICDSYVNQVVMIQKKVIRLITVESYLAHTNPLFKKISILKLSDLNVYFLSIEAYKMNVQSDLNLSQRKHDTRCTGPCP